MISGVTLMALIRKEFIQAFRDRRMLAMLAFVPIVQLVVFGYAANLEFNHAETVVVDEDHSEESRALVRDLAAEGTFSTRAARSVAEATAAIEEGRAIVVVIVPRGFGRDLGEGRPAFVQALVDGSDPSRSIAASGAIEQYAQRRRVQRMAADLAASGSEPPAVPQVRIEPRLLYNPSLKSRLFMVPGTAASLLVIVTTVITAMGLTREREIGTMEQLLVTPITPLTLMIGKTIPYAVFGLVDEAVILIVGNVVFDVPIRGPVFVVFLGAAVYLFSTLATGLLLATLARTQQQAIMAGMFFLLPAILLSGMLTPIDSMPRWLQPITYVDPVRYFVTIQRSVLLRGASLADVAAPMLALAALGVGLIALASVRFRRTLG